MLTQIAGGSGPQAFQAVQMAVQSVLLISGDPL
jgi:hypothetical protein